MTSGRGTTSHRSRGIFGGGGVDWRTGAEGGPQPTRTRLPRIGYIKLAGQDCRITSAMCVATGTAALQEALSHSEVSIDATSRSTRNAPLTLTYI